MGFMDELKKLARPYEDEDDFEEEDEALPEEQPQEEERSNIRKITRRERREDDRRAPRRDWEETGSFSAPASYSTQPSYTSPYTSGRDDYFGNSTIRPVESNKVVNINATTQLQVVLVKPDKFENASDIADHLRDKHTVVLNLESTNKDVARRLVDFLSGVAYAQEGKIKRISAATYMITPYSVDIIGDLTDELENSGLYF